MAPRSSERGELATMENCLLPEPTGSTSLARVREGFHPLFPRRRRTDRPFMDRGMVSVLTKEELEKLIDSAVTKAVAATLDIDPTMTNNRLAYSEPEASALLGVKPHVLRDARLRGEISATRVGGRLAYTRDDLCSYLERGKQ
jgi:hypothetical protein